MDDLISRKAVLDIAFKYCPDDDGVCSEAGSDLRNMLDEIENLPPAEPERLKGEWKIQKSTIHPYGNDVCCSICGHTMGSTFGYKFCPMCGADMREVNYDSN